VTDNILSSLIKQQLVALVDVELMLVPPCVNHSKITKKELQDLLAGPGSPFQTKAAPLSACASSTGPLDSVPTPATGLPQDPTPQWSA